MTTVGSREVPDRICATIEVVLVLPWEPAMAMPYLIRISSASISARGITGICRRRDSATSGLSGWIADEVTTTSQSPTFSGRWPRVTWPPSFTRRCTVVPASRSEPVTS